MAAWHALTSVWRSLCSATTSPFSWCEEDQYAQNSVWFDATVTQSYYCDFFVNGTVETAPQVAGWAAPANTTGCPEFSELQLVFAGQGTSVGQYRVTSYLAAGRFLFQLDGYKGAEDEASFGWSCAPVAPTCSVAALHTLVDSSMQALCSTADPVRAASGERCALGCASGHTNPSLEPATAVCSSFGLWEFFPATCGELLAHPLVCAQTGVGSCEPAERPQLLRNQRQPSVARCRGAVVNHPGKRCHRSAQRAEPWPWHAL